jgi:hypothetical protein
VESGTGLSCFSPVTSHGREFLGSAGLASRSARKIFTLWNSATEKGMKNDDRELGEYLGTNKVFHIFVPLSKPVEGLTDEGFDAILIKSDES